MATHIIGAYRIFGANHARLQDYCDDGEHGGGRRILNLMKEQNLFNLAIFIVRYKKGGDIGYKRFEIITELAKAAMHAIPAPLDTGHRDFAEERELAKSLKKAVSTLQKRKTGQTNEKHGDDHNNTN